MPRRHVLIGSGPAAMSAAETIRALDPTAEITMVCAEPQGYYSRPGLAYYLAKEVPEGQLSPINKKDMAALNIRFVFERVVGIDPAAHVVTLQSGGTLGYDRLLVATGSLAIPARVSGADLNGVVKLDDMADARDLIARSKHAKTAVVVGGGITALEIVEGLVERHVRVHYFMRKERYWSNVLSGEESRLVEEGLRECGVIIHYFTELAAILGSNGRVAAVETGQGERIPCEIVAIAIGVRPQVDIARNAGIECDRGILVDKYLASSVPDIYAAGDVAEVLDPRSDRRTLEVLWSSAVDKGRVAGANMVDQPHVVYDKGAAPLNVTRLAGFKITVIGSVGAGKDSDVEGLARGDSQTWRELGPAVTVETQDGECHLRLAVANHVIAGAIVIGDQEISFPLQDLVGAGADISNIEDRLFAPGAVVPPLVIEAWRGWRAQHA